MWFRAVLYSAGDVYYDAPSEPCLGCDHYNSLSRGRIPSILLLSRGIVIMGYGAQLPI